MIRIVDLTLPLAPGNRGVSMNPRFTVERDGWNGADWNLYSHAGTHMDARIHFAAGPETIDQHTPGRCMGPAWVVRLPGTAPRALLTVADLGDIATRFQPGDSLLIHTGWSSHAGEPEFYRDELPRISEELARWCVANQVKLLGVEPPSIADVNQPAEVALIHGILLGGGVTVVEGLVCLDQLTEERVYFFAMPLKLAGGDGSPVRAFAFDGPFEWKP